MYMENTRKCKGAENHVTGKYHIKKKLHCLTGALK